MKGGSEGGYQNLLIVAISFFWSLRAASNMQNYKNNNLNCIKNIRFFLPEHSPIQIKYFVGNNRLVPDNNEHTSLNKNIKYQIIE
jgi:hypothetical protein